MEERLRNLCEAVTGLLQVRVINLRRPSDRLDAEEII